MNDEEVKKHVEFSKRLTFFFLVIFSIHLGSLLVSAMMTLGDYQLIKDSFNGSLPFYGVIFTGYTAKAAFENYDKFTKQYKVTMKELEQESESVG